MYDTRQAAPWNRNATVDATTEREPMSDAEIQYRAETEREKQMAIQSQPRKPVVQESNGKATNTHSSLALFIDNGAYLSCQASELSDTIALSVSIGFSGRMSFHGTVADIGRMVELMRTTLEEYAGGETE